jgi:hypothetical protein
MLEPKPPLVRAQARLRDAVADELRVSLDGKLHDARAILLDDRTHGDGVWDR